jgi:hypothetical protein
MPKTILPIANGFYVSDSLPISAQECVNFFPVTEDVPSLNQETLRGSPGLEQVATTGTSSSDANRGSHLTNGWAYFVNGPSLYRLNPDLTVDELGTISGTGPVSMADNGIQMMILDPHNDAYIFDRTTDTLTQITDADFTANGKPRVVVFIDGYFCCTTNQKKFIVSALNDGLSWNALDFGSAESESDAILAPIVYKNQLFIAGTRTIEAFTNTGGAGFPFTRSGLFVDQGLASAFAVGSGPDVFIFAGKDSNETTAVWSFYGNSTTKVSTLAIDKILGELTQPERNAITSWSYGQNGHYFVGFVLPNTTIVYDISTGKWHERKSRIVTNGLETIHPWRAVNMVFAYSEMFAGDALDGHIGRISQNLKDEYSYEIIRTFATQPFQNNMEPFFVPMIELTVETGTGITAADGLLQPTCKIYECDAYQTAILDIIEPYTYWAFDWPEAGPYPTTTTDLGSAGIDGVLTTLHIEDLRGGYIDICGGPAHVPNPVGTTNIAGGSVVPDYWDGSISLLEDCTVGMLFNIDAARGSAESPMIFTSDPGFSWAYRVRLLPESNQVQLRSLSEWSSIFFNNTAATTDLDDILWDVGGASVWVNLILYCYRNEATQETTVKLWIDGALVADNTADFSGEPTADFLVDDNDDRPKIFQVKGDGPFTEASTGQIQVDHIWMVPGEITEGQVAAVQDAYERNKSDYVDPNPNCTPP